MGNICCESPRDNFKEEIINSISIEDIITYLKEKIKNATIEQNDLLTYLNDNNLKPSTINIDGFNEKDLKKRIVQTSLLFSFISFFSKKRDFFIGIVFLNLFLDNFSKSFSIKFLKFKNQILYLLSLSYNQVYIS